MQSAHSNSPFQTSVRIANQRVVWAAFWACVALAAFCSVATIYPLVAEGYAAQNNLGDLNLPDYLPGGGGTSGSAQPSPSNPAGSEESWPYPGAVFFVPWIFFVCAACVLWVVLLAKLSPPPRRRRP